MDVINDQLIQIRILLAALNVEAVSDTLTSDVGIRLSDIYTLRA